MSFTELGLLVIFGPFSDSFMSLLNIDKFCVSLSLFVYNQIPTGSDWIPVVLNKAQSIAHHLKI